MAVLESTNTMGLRPHGALWATTRFKLDLSQALVMGILNLTPDSFSDGGLHTNTKQSIAYAEQLAKDGADILDVGGESTRPGAKALDAEEEWRRVEPVLTELLSWNIPLSIDTYHPQTMARALDVGVDIVNDVWALRQAGALETVASRRCGICLMHMHGEPQTMQLNPIANDVMDTLTDFFNHQLALTDQAGIQRERIVIDPGIGFGKTVIQNFDILRKQSELLRLGSPLMLGWSNKSSLGAVSGLSVGERLIPSIAAAVLALERGARVLRVHAVAETVAALSIWNASQHICENGN
jgi:dihydropteroate synthase